jgi:hypothetical protein
VNGIFFSNIIATLVLVGIFLLPLFPCELLWDREMTTVDKDSDGIMALDGNVISPAKYLPHYILNSGINLSR